MVLGCPDLRVWRKPRKQVRRRTVCEVGVLRLVRRRRNSEVGVQVVQKLLRARRAIEGQQRIESLAGRAVGKTTGCIEAGCVVRNWKRSVSCHVQRRCNRLLTCRDLLSSRRGRRGLGRGAIEVMEDNVDEQISRNGWDCGLQLWSNRFEGIGAHSMARCKGEGQRKDRSNKTLHVGRWCLVVQGVAIMVVNCMNRLFLLLVLAGGSYTLSR